MSPEQAQQLLQHLANGVSLSTAAYLLLFGFWIVGLALAAAIGGYVGQRAKTAAIERDLATITDHLRRTTAATEEIKTRLSGELWVQQERWKLKRDLYLRLLDSLAEMGSSLEMLMSPLGTPEQRSTEAVKAVAALERLQAVVRVADLILGEASLAELTRFNAELEKARDPGIPFVGEAAQTIILAALKNVRGTIVAAARDDLTLR